MPSPINITNIPAPRVEFIDPRTGLMSREWYRFFLNLFNLTGAGTNDTSLTDLQIGPPVYDLTGQIAQISDSAQLAAMSDQAEAVLGQLGIVYDQAQLASMIAQYEQATLNLQNQFDTLPAAPQLGTIASYNLNGSPTAGGVGYGTGSAVAFTPAGTSGQFLTSAAAGVPTWTTPSSVAVTSFSAGTTGFTPSSATTGAVTLAGTLAVANGGTGQTSYAVGDLLYASTTTALSKLADVATGNALISGGVGVAPSWGKIGLTTHVSGTLPVANGGTGTATAFTAGSVLFAGASGVYSQDNAQFFWDDTNNRLGVGTATPSYTIHSTGIIGSTLTGSPTTGAGQLYLNGATSNRIDFNANGVAAPSFTTRSVGTKVVWFPILSASVADYATGIEGSVLWNSVPTTAESFKWYGGTTLAATLTGAGALSLTGALSVATSAGGQMFANATGTNQASLELQRTGATKWQIGMQADNSLFMYDIANLRDFLRVSSGNVLLAPSGGNVGIGTTTPSAKLHVSGGGADTRAYVFSGSAANFAGISVGRTAADVDFGVAAAAGQWSSDAAAGDVVLRTATATQKLLLQTGFAAATIALSSGNVGIGTAAPTQKLDVAGVAAVQGVKFPATQVASADANTLDDYEEGNFTPTIVGFPTAGVGVYAIQVGRYTKIGRSVNIQFRVAWTAHTGTGDMTIGGLPFTPLNVTDAYAAVTFGFVNNVAYTAGATPMGYVIPNSATISLVQMPSGGGAMAALPMDVAGDYIISANYTTA